MKTKILIVDDMPKNIEALSELIESDDVEIFAASGAEQALELISLHEFGLALLDVQMPVTSGFELSKIIRGVKRFRSLPIIFVTAHREDSSVIFEGYSTGAVDVLFKPLDANIVRAKVRVFVELAQQKALLQSHVQELERLRIEAESANIAKSQFLANMSHEIRTPLAAVMGFAELIARNQPPQSQSHELMAGIERNGQLLLRLIDDILDLSKIEANRLDLEQADFDLFELLKDISTTLAFRAREKGLRLGFVTPQVIQSRYVSDPTRIKQVFLNIIGNAIKFTPTGAVDVHVTIEPSTSGGDLLVARVQDQGVGLTEDQATRLFQPFGQADPSTRRQFGGSGLGLVISRQIARSMGGDVRLIESAPKKGSIFEISFSLERPQRSAVPEESVILKPLPGRVLKGSQILAVDDSPDNLTLIELFLQDTGVQVTFAENGSEAVSQARAGNFDLILMDIQMPGMDGHQATKEIRKMGFSGPIVALTAHAIRSEHEKCRKSGCNAVLTKPFTRTSLLDGLGNYLSSV